MARGKDILDAAEKGLVKAAEHFLRLDPKCIERKDADGRETQDLKDFERGVRKVRGVIQLIVGMLCIVNCSLLQLCLYSMLACIAHCDKA